MTNAFSWFVSAFQSLVSGLNLSITLGTFTFGLFDLFVAAALLGIVVRNFVHIAR